MELTDGQSQLLEKIVKWFHNWESGLNIGEHPQWFSYSGRAGCGKTVVAKEVIKYLGINSSKEYVACAYVGKAVLQLQKNKMNAKTIHSLIYNLRYVKKIDASGNPYLGMEFILKDRLDEDYRLIIVDEAAMVNNTIKEELLSFGIPIIFMGDMNQLPPVFGTSNILEKPDHILTQIMRQKEGDPIIQLGEMVLNGIPLIEGDYGLSKVVRNYELDHSILRNYDQILCTTNKSRENINTFVREKLKGYDNLNPRLFEKIICRQNNWDMMVEGYSLTNGLTGYISDIFKGNLHRGYYLIDFQPDFLPSDYQFIGVKMDSKYITAPLERQKMMGRIKFEKFEYAYAITVHLSQGSQWPRVLFIDSFFHDAELTRRCRYTAITRAESEITIVLN